MAVVHLARQRDLQRLVALKELGGFNARDPAFAERFLRESRMAGSLNHPNIVTVYEYFEDGGTPYIAMELIEGGSLRPLIGELSLPKVARVLEDLLAAVGYAGRAGIVHRDLKHENALVTKEGRVKVADFGIAKIASSGQAGLTSEGMTVGTPEYMSPEQALARDVGPASDLYSIGCMTYEMLTGRLPFQSESQAALLVAHVNDTVPDVREIDPMIPESIALWVARMTEKDPDDRFPDAGAAWEAFEEAVLEHIGPLWRRDATIEPGSGIDLSDIPAQTDTPLRPKGTSQSAPPGGATGYQTYHAPAAMHELLDTNDKDAAPAVATPPPRPAARPPKRVTAPPVPVVSGKPERDARPTDDSGEEAPERGLPVGAIAGAAVAALIIAFVIGMTGGGGEKAASVTGDGFTLNAPAGWKEAPPDPDSKGFVAVAPSGAAAGEVVSAGRLPTSEALQALRNSGDVAHVKLGAGEAVSTAADGSPTAYLLPTSEDVVVIFCGAGAAVRDACPDVAGSLDLTAGKAVAPGPTDDGASALGGALTRLKNALGNPTEDLSRARSAGAQATAAGDLSRVYRAAATDVKRADVGALATGARDQLANALRSAGSAWSRYASAARAKSARAVGNARAAIASAKTRIGRARTALAATGYEAGGG